MKSFLLKGKSPTIKWGLLHDGIFFEGNVPEGYSLAVSPSDSYMILDVDRHGTVDGFDNIPDRIKEEIEETFNYKTRNNGRHFWFRYTGNKELKNKTSGLGLDLRTNKGYVVFYPKQDVRDCLPLMLDSTETMNNWLESLFI